MPFSIAMLNCQRVNIQFSSGEIPASQLSNVLQHLPGPLSHTFPVGKHDKHVQQQILAPHRMLPKAEIGGVA